MMRRRVVLAVLLLMLSAGSARATHIAVTPGTGHAGPITTVSAAVLEKHQFSIEAQAEYLRFDTFSEAELIRFAEQDTEVHNMESVMRYIIGIGYGITDATTIHARIPYIRRENIEESEPPDEAHRHGDAQGFGDLALYLHHRFYRSAAKDLEATLLVGLKLPTGRTTDKDDHGEPFETEFQPGSGSWDPSIGIAATKRLGSFTLDTSLLYTLVTEGAQETDLGDTFSYNLALSYRALARPVELDLIIEGNGVWLQKEEVAGRKDENSGGNTLLLSPGARLTFDRHFSTYVSLGIPVLQDLNGEQNELDYRLVFGVGWAF